MFGGILNSEFVDVEDKHRTSIDRTIKRYIRTILQDPDTRNVFFFLLLNITFTIVEFLYGMWNNSLGLTADAVHMLFDSTAIIFSLIASVISKWDSSSLFTYGYGRVETLCGFINALALVFASGNIIWDALERFVNPEELKMDNLLTVSVLGLLVNIVGIFAFDHGGSVGKKNHDCGHDHSGDGLLGGGHGHVHSSSCSHGHDHHNDSVGVSIGHNSHSDHSGHNHNHKGHNHGQDTHDLHDRKHSSQKHGHDSHNGHNHGHDNHKGHNHGHDNHKGHNHGHGAYFPPPVYSPVPAYEQQHLHANVSHAGHNHNHGKNPLLHGMFLHIVSDALGSIGVIISSLLIKYYSILK
jgi:solute carrier family 30 (zinc transporter), member 5/7